MAIALCAHIFSVVGQFFSGYAGDAAEALNIMCAVFMALAGIIQIIATVMILKEDKFFVYSLILMVLEIVSGVLITGTLFQAGSVIYTVLQLMSMIGGVVASCLFCMGIVNIFSPMGKDGIIQSANDCIKLFKVLAFISMALSILTSFIVSTGILTTIAIILSIAYVALIIAANSRYILLLLTAHKVIA